jgi:hypothetical protein
VGPAASHVHASLLMHGSAPLLAMESGQVELRVLVVCVVHGAVLVFLCGSI